MISICANDMHNVSIEEAVWTGLEPVTSCVTGRHSNQLNYQTSYL